MIASLWESMASWLTPTSLFLFLNLMIGTIVITSRFGTRTNPHHQHHFHGQLGHYDSPPPPARAPSLLERVKSINLSLYKFDPPTPETEHLHLQHSQLRYETQDPNPDGLHQLARQPSLLDRYKSMNFSRYKFEQPTPEREHIQLTEPEPETHSPPQLARQSSLLGRLMSINFSSIKFEHHIPETEYTQPTEAEFQTHIDPLRLDRQPSLLDRFKTFKFPSFYPHEQPNPVTETDQDSYNNPRNGHLVKRSKSGSRNGASKNSQPEKMKKSASDKAKGGNAEDGDEKRGSETVSFGWEDEEVDAKADDFINRFKNQLRLQRLDSLKRFGEMFKGK